MFDKLLALTSVTAVAGFGLAITLGACSSSSAPADDLSTATDAGALSDARGRTPPPAGGEDPPEEACGPKGEPVTAASLEAEFGWKPPRPRQNACTPADLKAIQSVKQLQTYADFVMDTSEACRACALTTKDAPNWGPIISGDPPGMLNFGACFAAADKPECGKAIQFLDLCTRAACAQCTTLEGYNACSRTAQQGPQCDALFAEAQAQCTAQEAFDQCADIVDAITYLCAFEGADAGMPDGGNDPDGG